MAMRTAVSPRNHGRRGARAAANPSDPSPTAPSTSGPMQQIDASSPAISDPARALRSFTTRLPLRLEVVTRAGLELLRALVAAGHVFVLGDAHMWAAGVYREDDAADRALAEVASPRAGLGLHVLRVVLELRGAGEAAHARHRGIEVPRDLPLRVLARDGRCSFGGAARTGRACLRGWTAWLAALA